jgi:hypothetical protein
MKRHLALLLLGLAVVLVAAGQLARAAGGPGPNDIEDSLPAWHADGVHLAFERTAPQLQHVVSMTSAGKDTYVAYFTGSLRGYAGNLLLVEAGDETLVTTGARFGGPPNVIHGTYASGRADGSRVAYVRGGTLYSSKPDASDERALASGVAPSDTIGPAWSPDGRQIAVSSGASLLVVRADGSGSRVLTPSGSNPSWSDDGRTLAFEREGQVWLIGADGTGERMLAPGRLPQFSPVSTSAVAYISNRQHIPGGATPYRYALYVQTIGGVAHKLVDDVHPYSPPRWSPTAALIAVAAGQECERWGISIVRSSGGQAHRRSNLCRIEGTSGPDRLVGSPYYDIIRGFGGNDFIKGNPGNDRIEGNDGNDRIVAGPGNDFVFGGPGDDTIFGGTGNDTIIGGNGHDRIDCGAGNDTVEGAGPLDRIAKNCEHVRR